MILHVEESKAKKAQGADIRLISLDFDGTILVYDDPSGVFHPAVIELLNALEPRGIQWCANSGREFEDQRVIVERSRQRGLTHLPVALICCESMVFYRNGSDFHSLEPWNRQAHEQLMDCHRIAQRRLHAHIPYIQETYQPVTSMIGELYTAFLLRDQNGAPRELHGEMATFLEGLDDVMLIRNGGWVAVTHRALGKGNALKEFARHLQLPTDHILAIGDHHNDLSMLSRDIARHVGCPGDAIPEVRQAVDRAGGCIADQSGPLGTVEVIQSLVGG